MSDFINNSTTESIINFFDNIANKVIKFFKSIINFIKNLIDTSRKSFRGFKVFLKRKLEPTISKVFDSLDKFLARIEEYLYENGWIRRTSKVILDSDEVPPEFSGISKEIDVTESVMEQCI